MTLIKIVAIAFTLGLVQKLHMMVHISLNLPIYLNTSRQPSWHRQLCNLGACAILYCDVWAFKWPNSNHVMRQESRTMCVYVCVCWKLVTMFSHSRAQNGLVITLCGERTRKRKPKVKLCQRDHRGRPAHAWLFKAKRAKQISKSPHELHRSSSNGRKDKRWKFKGSKMTTGRD